MLLVIPLAGRGTRYSNVGYTTPKPLIEVVGKPMLYHAFQSVKNVKYSKLVFIALSEHEKLFGVRKLIQEQITENFELILLDEVTEGQLCTVLKAAPYFKENEGLLIAASDSYIESNIGYEINNSDADGIISVIDMPGEQWSFAKTNDEGNVIEVAEKVKISNHASTGIYYFNNSKKFELEARKIIGNKETNKGEYYIMPLFNKLIKKGAIIKLSNATAMWDMGTPEAKQKFEQYLYETKI
jgi:NDP-sugar pyrophosphorylase family protein